MLHHGRISICKMFDFCILDLSWINTALIGTVLWNGGVEKLLLVITLVNSSTAAASQKCMYMHLNWQQFPSYHFIVPPLHWYVTEQSYNFNIFPNACRSFDCYISDTVYKTEIPECQPHQYTRCCTDHVLIGDCCTSM